MAAEVQLAIVRDVLAACNSQNDPEVGKRVPAMLKVLSQNLRHADRRVRYAAVASFSAMVRNYKESISDRSILEEFDSARSVLAENQNEGDIENFELINGALVELGFAQNEEGYMDSFIQPDYVDASSIAKSRNRMHGMILRLAPAVKNAIPGSINAGVVQMRMVLVAGVISASLRIEQNDSAEDSSDALTGTIGKIFLSVKVAPGDDGFLHDLSKAILDGTDKQFKLGNVDYWETHKSDGKATPADTLEKSTEFAESECPEVDDGMYLDDDEKLASRATGKKKGGVSKSRPWSMFNPSSALGLNSVFNSPDLLEMIEYDAEEAAESVKRKQEEDDMAEPAKPAVRSFGIFRRLFG